MTAITCPQPRTFNPAPLLLLAALLLAVIYGTHAVARHGTEADAVRECMSSNGPIQRWRYPDNNRIVSVCQLPDGKFGIQVTERLREVTSYIKNRMSRLEQVETYLRNRGAVKYWQR
jgi:hypothetical protein